MIFIGESMDRMYRRVSVFCRAILMSIALLCSSFSYAFELLSEGAMDSVSAVSVESAEDIINIAGSPAAGLTVDGFEALPFRSRVSVGSDETDEVVEELDYALVQEVEAWADELRVRVGSGFEVGYVEELPQPRFETTVIFDDSEVVVESSLGNDRDDETRYQIGRVDQTLQVLESGANTITYQFERYIDRAATVDADPFDEGRTVGSGYISELRSYGTVTLISVRDGDKQLF